MTFLNRSAMPLCFAKNLTFYSWQIISHLEEHIHVPFGILIEFLVNRKRAAIYTVLPHSAKNADRSSGESRAIPFSKPLNQFDISMMMNL